MRRPEGSARTVDRLRRGELSLMAAGLFAIAAVLAVGVRGSGLPLPVDRLTTGVVGSARSHPRLTIDLQGLLSAAFLRPVVTWGTIVSGVAIPVALAALAWRRGDRWAVLVSITAPVLAMVVVEVLAKPLVDRHHDLALAFPSGHATAVAAAATLVLVMLNRWYGWRRALRFLPAVALLPLVVGAALIRLDWHYPTDVVGGIAFGSAVVVALAAAVPSPGAHPAGERPGQLTPTRSTTNTRVSSGPMTPPAPRLP